MIHLQPGDTLVMTAQPESSAPHQIAEQMRQLQDYLDKFSSGCRALVIPHGSELRVFPKGTPMQVTAKVALGSKKSAAYPDASELTFYPDYADGRNKEWAVATPSLTLTMIVKNDVAELFEPSARYTLTFEPSES